MTAAIGQILGSAVGVAISPVPVIALILMLFSNAARRNSLLFLLGWLVGLLVATLGVLAIGLEPSSGGPSTTSGVIKVLIGLLFVGLGFKQWKSRPAAGTEAQAPSWMSAIDDLSAAKALGMGLVLTLANPKNLGLSIAAAVSISGAGLTGSDEWVVVGVFVLIASVSIITPVAGYLIAGERATPLLTSLKAWLIANNATVMTVLFVVLGAKVLGEGMTILG